MAPGPVFGIREIGVVIRSHELFQVGEELRDGFGPRAADFDRGWCVFDHDFFGCVQALINIVFFESPGDGFDSLGVVVKINGLVAIDTIAPAIV